MMRITEWKYGVTLAKSAKRTAAIAITEPSDYLTTDLLAKSLVKYELLCDEMELEPRSRLGNA